MKNIQDDLKDIMGPNNVSLHIRIPAELSELINKKAKQENIEIPQFVREILLESFMPEILHKLLEARALDWLTQQGESGIELSFGKKLAELEKIKDMTQFVIEETNKFQDAFIQAETDYLNRVSDKIQNSPKN